MNERAARGRVTADDPAITSWRARVRGEVILPGEAHYDEARQVYNASIDRRPALIVRCADVADVILAVEIARERGLPAAIRGGGHNVAGLGSCDDGVLIDLGRLRGIRVDPRARRVRVEGGCTWGEVDHATHAFGLAAPSGVVSTTGVAGLTLGGGFGYLTRQYGLACDNLLSADVVCADGVLRVASAEENPELLWALRGGGGNFGVVTSLEFQLHPVDTIYGGPLFYPIDRGAEVMKLFRSFIASAPEEVSAFFTMLIAPPAPFVPPAMHGQKFAAIVASSTAPRARAEAQLAPLRTTVPPVLDLLGPMPYPALNQLFDPLLPRGLHHYWKADFVRELTDEAIAVHMKFGPQVPTIQSGMHLYPLNGAVHRIARDATAFSHRDMRFVHVILAIDADPARLPAETAWVRDYWSALHPHSEPGSYVNFMMDEGEERLRAAYRENYGRLATIKHKYDPQNLFCVNHNILPSVAATPATSTPNETAQGVGRAGNGGTARSERARRS